MNKADCSPERNHRTPEVSNRLIPGELLVMATVLGQVFSVR